MMNAAALRAALGDTPPGTPNSQNTFRAQRTELQAALQSLSTTSEVAPPVASSTTTTRSIGEPLKPRVGGITMVNGYPVAWVGGGIGAAALTGPASLYAYRTSDLSLALKVEKACTIGLPEGRRLPPPGSMDTKDVSVAITLNMWIRSLAIALKERGLDTVFRADVGGTEIFLLEKWGKATKENVDVHVQRLRTLNDPYDLTNLKLSATYLMNSLDDDMLRRTQRSNGS
jgi:hypothetical protein